MEGGREEGKEGETKESLKAFTKFTGNGGARYRTQKEMGQKLLVQVPGNDISQCLPKTISP